MAGRGRDHLRLMCCECCDFKVGCIIAAVCRVVITVAASVSLFVIYFVDELKEKVLQKGYVTEGELAFLMIFSIPVSIVTIRCSYWFIRGATSINKARIDRMFHYSVLELATFVALVVSFNVICVFLAMIEFYLTCCSFLLIGERKKLSQQITSNDAETPPPQYESCVNGTQLQAFAIQQNAETESDADTIAGVETIENSFKNAVKETNPTEIFRIKENIFKNDGEDASIHNAELEGGKENVEFKSDENCFKNAREEPDDENSIQNK